MKGKTGSFNRKSIKVKLLLIPIVVVIFAVVGIGLVSTSNTSKSLLNEMSRNGQFILEELVKRIEDNSRSLDVINYTIEEDIRMIVKSVQRLQDDVSNDQLTQIATDFNVGEINFFNREGVIQYSNI